MISRLKLTIAGGFAGLVMMVAIIEYYLPLTALPASVSYVPGAIWFDLMLGTRIGSVKNVGKLRLFLLSLGLANLSVVFRVLLDYTHIIAFLPAALLSIGVGAPVAFRIVLKAEGVELFPGPKEEVSAIWWALPLTLGLFGGVAGYFGLRNRNRGVASYILMAGAAWTFVLLAIIDIYIRYALGLPPNLW